MFHVKQLIQGPRQAFPSYDYINACAAALPLPLTGEGWGGVPDAYAVA